MKKEKSTMGILLAGMFLMALILGGCSSNDEPNELPNERYDIELTPETKAAATDLVDFYINFTKDAVSYVDANPNNRDKNIVVSPLSTYLALSMLANSSDEETAKEISDYLGVGDIKSLNELSLTLLRELPLVDRQSKMAIANSYWIDGTRSYSSDISNILTKFYMASMFKEDFKQGATVDKINRWCSDNTNGRIPKIIDEISPEVEAMLINALYYKSSWADSPFKAEDTEKDKFFGLNGTSDVEMMCSKESKRDFYRDENFEAFTLTFGNKAFSYQVVLPAEGLSPEDSNKLLTPEQWKRFGLESVSCNLTIYMPKYKNESKISLDDVFKSRGLNFCDDISFNLLNPVESGNIRFKQSTFLEINEDGAEAAAVTNNDVTMAPPILEPNGTYSVKLNRPFYFRIYERSTGACLLSGRISDL